MGGLADGIISRASDASTELLPVSTSEGETSPGLPALPKGNLSAVAAPVGSPGTNCQTPPGG